MNDQDPKNIREEIEIFKEKMKKVESLIYEVNTENKELQICFSNLIKLMNHELISSLNNSSEILKHFRIK